MVDPAPSAPWGTCLYCGDAVPPDTDQCPICGAREPLRPSEVKTASRQARRRRHGLMALRGAIVVGAIIGLSYLMVTAALSGPPVITDPLTTKGTYVMAPTNTTVLAGSVTGEDYILGNFTVLEPFHTAIGLIVYNQSEYQQYEQGIQTTNMSWTQPSYAAAVDFDAPYTDTYYFVFYNPYPVASQLTVTAYIATTYTPDVQSEA